MLVLYQGHWSGNQESLQSSLTLCEPQFLISKVGLRVDVFLSFISRSAVMLGI